jgi:hypothetical protein
LIEIRQGEERTQSGLVPVPAPVPVPVLHQPLSHCPPDNGMAWYGMGFSCEAYRHRHRHRSSSHQLPPYLPPFPFLLRAQGGPGTITIWLFLREKESSAIQVRLKRFSESSKRHSNFPTNKQILSDTSSRYYTYSPAPYCSHTIDERRIR